MWLFEPPVVIKTWCMFGLGLVEQGNTDKVQSCRTMGGTSMIPLYNLPCFWDVFFL